MPITISPAADALLNHKKLHSAGTALQSSAHQFSLAANGLGVVGALVCIGVVVLIVMAVKYGRSAFF
jgi:hypothetical protein